MVEEPAFIYPIYATELENVPPPVMPREPKRDLQVFSGKAPHEQKNAYNRVYSYSISEDAMVEMKKLRRRTNILFIVIALLILLVLVLGFLTYFLFFRSLSTTKSKASTQVANSSRDGLLAGQTKPSTLFTTSPPGPKSPKSAALVSFGERRVIPFTTKVCCYYVLSQIHTGDSTLFFIRARASKLVKG